MKKILFILGTYKPKPSPNGICIEKVAKQLLKNGYKVSCICSKPYKEKEFEVIEGVNIYRIKGRVFYRLNEWVDNNKSNKYASLISKLALIINRIKNVIFIGTWPLISPIYMIRLYNKSKEIYIKEGFDCVVGVYTPIDALIAAHLTKKKFKNIKFIGYFLDCFSGGVGPKYFSDKWNMKRCGRWEKILLNNADKVFIMKSHKKHHDNFSKDMLYYDKIVTLDIPLIFKIRDGKVFNECIKKDKINISYIGSLQYQVKNPQYLLKVFSEINNSRYNINFIGTHNCAFIFKEIKDKDRNNVIHEVGKISHDEAISTMKNSDILINIGSSNACQIPCKIYEYMSTGRPIISTYITEDEPSIPYLKKYPLALLIKEDYNMIKSNAKKIEEFIYYNTGKMITFDEVVEKFYYNTCEPFVQEIDKLFDNYYT